MLDVINVAIVEDEKIQAELLKKYVQNWACDRNIRVITENYLNGESFDFSWSMDKKYHILLLDVQMSELNGIELAKRVREKDDMINIIFITAVTDYIHEGYDVSAINYLIKPIKEQKLHECLNKAVSKLPKEEKTILFNIDGEVHRVAQKDIIFIEAFAHYIEISTTKGKYAAKKNISDIEKELEEGSFIRCHRSYIVGLRFVKRIGSSELELDNGSLVPISRRQYSNTNVAFIKYFRSGINE